VEPNNLFEDFRKSLRKEIGDGFKKDQWDPLFGDAQEAAKENKDAVSKQQEYIAKQYVDTFTTSSGQFVLQHMHSMYCEQPTFFPQMKDNAREYAIWRDGNNHVVRQLVSIVRHFLNKG
jgi:hypothetical protein